MSRRPPDLVDCHCHLTAVAEAGLDPAAVLARAEVAGVRQVVTSADGVEEGERALRLAERLAGVYVTIGWQPTRSRPPDDRTAARLAGLLRHELVVGVGEIGLDYLVRPGQPPPDTAVQIEQLRLMLELARAAGRPAVIHDRLAHADVLSELARAGGRPALLHCFSGDAELARRSAAHGHILSFSGMVTFANAPGVRAAAAAAPDGQLVVETDAPFLSPAPHRGRPNEPSRVAVTAARVAALRGQGLAELAAATSRTARAFYGLAPA